MILTCRMGSSKSGAQRVLSLRPPPLERRYCLQFPRKMNDSGMPGGLVQIGGATRIEAKATPIRETILLAIPKENE